uniref:Uncharacterized protein n=1 Tax=Noccaea caerulescens TaxID=107243 RepID=A0A1J3IUT5_NOCCA
MSCSTKRIRVCSGHSRVRVGSHSSPFPVGLCSFVFNLGQSYVTSEKHGESPESSPLLPDFCVEKAETGWAHCVAVTENHELNRWGWRECIPTWRGRIHDKETFPSFCLVSVLLLLVDF